MVYDVLLVCGLFLAVIFGVPAFIAALTMWLTFLFGDDND